MYNPLDSEIYISEKHTRDSYIALDLRLSSSNKTWNDAIDIFKDRIEGRYLQPIKELIDKDPNKYGFSAMALCSLLIETLMQFFNGYPKTPDSMNKECYASFLVEELGHIFNQKKADLFYKGIRCGILHSAQTTYGCQLTFGEAEAVQMIDGRTMRVNVQKICDELEQYYDWYCKKLEKRESTELRTNFLIKMNDITKRWFESDLLYDMWDGICAFEGQHIDNSNDSFSFYVDSFRNTLRIPTPRNTIMITKDMVNNAFYYWPKLDVISKMKYGKYILAIFIHCENVVESKYRECII